jgi:hypothetical protein
MIRALWSPPMFVSVQLPKVGKQIFFVSPQIAKLQILGLIPQIS